MNFKNIMFDYFIGFANLGGYVKQVQVEHYFAEDSIDCIKQCLYAHGIWYDEKRSYTERELMKLAEDHNFLISFPRKVKMTII